MLLWSQHAFVIFIFSSIIYTYYFSATLRNSTLTKQGKQNRQTYRKRITIVMMIHVIHVIIEWPILEIIIVFNDLKSIYRFPALAYISHSKAIYDWVLYMQWLYIINWYIYNIVVKLTFFNIYFILHFYNITFIIFKIIISYFINQYCCIIIIENWKN